MTAFGPRKRRKCRNAVCACTGACFRDDDTIKQLDRLTDFLVQDILEMSDEEIIQEMIEDGIDPEQEGVRMREIIDKAVEKAKELRTKGSATND